MKSSVTLVLVVFLVLSVFVPSYAMGQLMFLQNSLTGKSAPDFSLKLTNGQTAKMSEYRDGKGAIIFFWATWCPHCRTALQRLNVENKAIQENDIKLILVDLGEDEAVVKDYLNKNQIELAAFLDTESTSAEAYGVVGIPTFILVDPQGIIKSVEHAFPENYASILVKEEPKKKTK